MIRAATADDIPRIVELGKLLHESSSYADLSFDEGKVAALMESLINGAGVVFVSDRDGLVVGGIAGGITEHWFSKEKLAFDYSFFIDPKFRHGITALRLAAAFIEWGEIRGATRVTMGITTDISVNGTARLYESLGMKLSGVFFGKELNHGN